MNHWCSRALTLAVLGAALSLSGCSTDDNPAANRADENTGAIGLELQAAGQTFDSFTYAITGAGGFSKTGTIDVSHSNTLSAVIGGLPAGLPLTITVNGASRDGSLTCGGAASFTVMAQATTMVVVHLQCHQGSGATGPVVIGGTINVCAAIDGLSAAPAEVMVGSAISFAATAHDLDGGPAPLAYQWTSTGGALAGATTATPTLTCTGPGAVTVTLTVTDGDCGDTLSAVVTCTGSAMPDAAVTPDAALAPDAALTPDTATPDAAAGTAKIVINEVESSGGVPGDWVELYNAGTAPADLSGWKFKDNDDSHAFYVIPAGTVVAPGAYLLLEEAQFVFGLGAADSARLWDAAGVPVDSYSWTAHAAITYGRCPNGTGDLVSTTASTKGAANACSGGTGGSSPDAGSDGAVASSFPWPGTDPVVTVDVASTFGANLSGLNYQPATASNPAVLWAVQNGPSKIFRLLWSGTNWVPDTADGWGAGKLLHYPGGTGAPDSEGLTTAEWTDAALYVSTERDNNNNGTSRLSVLRFDGSAAGTELTATNDWNLTADLPAVGPNLGLEAITYVPDAALVAGGFFDEATHAAYDPAHYPNHGTGLFFVGVEGNGNVYGYALDHGDNSFTRVATFASGQVAIMDLAYDRETGDLWGYCDNTCGNKATVFRLDRAAMSPTAGRFQIGRVFDRPASLPNSNFEGISFAPLGECTGGQRSFFWSDDDQLDGHAIRRGSISCSTLF